MKKINPEKIQWLTPQEKKAFDIIFADPKYRAEARVLRAGITKWTKMLRRVYRHVAAQVDIFREEYR